MARQHSGIAPAGHGRERTPELPEAILAAVADGLSQCCLARRPVASPREDASETLMHFDLDGFRYALTRRRVAEDVHLSPRETEIICLVASGLPNKCIGAVLEISTWTVATHLRRIFAKLGVSSRAAMIARAGNGAYQAKPTSAGRAMRVPSAAPGSTEIGLGSIGGEGLGTARGSEIPRNSVRAQAVRASA